MTTDKLATLAVALGTWAWGDLYWIHNPADVERWTRDLIPLLRSEKVKHVGVSNHNLSEIELANRILEETGFAVDAVQGHYSLLYRGHVHAGILNYCRSHGIPFVAYIVLEQGALSGKYSPETPLPEGTNRAQGCGWSGPSQSHHACRRQYRGVGSPC
jgi:aryl-alcohol dehydrogenase-like predicted oxidoreductase